MAYPVINYNEVEALVGKSELETGHTYFCMRYNNPIIVTDEHSVCYLDDGTLSSIDNFSDSDKFRPVTIKMEVN